MPVYLVESLYYFSTIINIISGAKRRPSLFNEGNIGQMEIVSGKSWWGED